VAFPITFNYFLSLSGPLGEGGLTIVPTCPFARAWLRRHPDEAARVSIDGRPLVPSAPVPARAFTLRWSMDRCVILNGRTSLTGDVEMMVFHDGDHYTASVQPIDLHVLSDAGDEVMSRPFWTSTPLAAWSPS